MKKKKQAKTFRPMKPKSQVLGSMKPDGQKHGPGYIGQGHGSIYHKRTKRGKR